MPITSQVDKKKLGHLYSDRSADFR